MVNVVVVSIPLWFSLNIVIAYSKLGKWYGFPSHYGSRSTNCPPERNVRPRSVSIPLWFSLNLLKIGLVVEVEIVSIPLWFSLNNHGCESAEGGNTCFHPTMVLAQPDGSSTATPQNTTFPSHYGSRSTDDRTRNHVLQAWFPSHYGSRSTIPLFKESPEDVLFPSHYGSRSTIMQLHLATVYTVSIPLWFSLNAHTSPSTAATGRVSIPLWFSLNDSRLHDREGRHVFPSHYGSRSTLETPSFTYLFSVFPSHYGSRSTKNLLVCIYVH